MQKKPVDVDILEERSSSGPQGPKVILEIHAKVYLT